jgi:hypothetical protein
MRDSKLAHINCFLWRVEEENEFVAIDLAHTRWKTGNFHAMQRLIHLEIIGECQPLPEHRTSYTIQPRIIA